MIVQATQREKRALKGQDKIALRVGKVLNQFKVNKYYNLEITEEGFSYQRKLELIAQETALDGVYVLRTSLESTLMDAATTVKAYKSLSQVEETVTSPASTVPLLLTSRMIRKSASPLNPVSCALTLAKDATEKR